MKYVKINGRNFEICGTKYAGAFCAEYATIWHAYDRPSYAKERIFEDWQDWARDTAGVYDFGIGSKNTFNFTVGCNLYADFERFKDDKPFAMLYITQAHDRIFPVAPMNAGNFAKVLEGMGYEVETY